MDADTVWGLIGSNMETCLVTYEVRVNKGVTTLVCAVALQAALCTL